jgi:hypothetical protein
VQPVAQQLPDVPGMVGDPGELLDHRGDARKGPVVAVEAVHAGTLPQRLVDGGKLGRGQARGVPGRAGAAQRLQPALRWDVQVHRAAGQGAHRPRPPVSDDTVGGC